LRQRHSAAHLVWRGVVAAIADTAMVTGVYPLVPHLGMAVSRWRRRRDDALVPLRAAAGEWAVSLAMSAARPLGFAGLPVSLRRARGPRPVILIHGYAMNRANFLPLARRLAVAGLGPLYGFEYWSLGKVSSAARRLGAFVEQVCEASGADRVDLVGHSMGGVVGRYYVSLAGGAARVRNLITIGTPHRGTGISLFGVGRPTRELAPGSPFLQRLGAASPPPGVRVTSIWSRADGLVPSRHDTRLPGVDEFAFDDLGHLSLLASRRVAEIIAARLREP